MTVTEPEDSIKKTDSPEAFKISSDMELPELSLIHPYVGIASQFKRVQELQFQITINRGFLKKKVFAGFEKLTKGENLLEKWEGDYFKIYKKVNPQNQEEHYEKVNKNEKDSPFVFIKGIVNCDENNKTDTKEGNSIEIHLKNYEQITINSVFCLIQIISILRIYDINFGSPKNVMLCLSL